MAGRLGIQTCNFRSFGLTWKLCPRPCVSASQWIMFNKTRTTTTALTRRYYSFPMVYSTSIRSPTPNLLKQFLDCLCVSPQRIINKYLYIDKSISLLAYIHKSDWCHLVELIKTIFVVKSHVFLARVEAWDGRSHGNISEVLSGFLRWLLWPSASYCGWWVFWRCAKNNEYVWKWLWVIENDLHDTPKRRF